MRLLAVFVTLIFSFGFGNPAHSNTAARDMTAGALPSSYTNLIDSIPDYYQRDTAFGGLPGAGAVYCGPVAVSNSLFWLSRQGFPSLVDRTDNARHDQFHLIRSLGSRRYFDTGGDGSNVQDLCSGVKRFLDDRGIHGKVRFEGMYAADDAFKTGTVPRLGKIKEYTIGYRAAWLNIGWYSYNPKRKEYTKTGGHWVTLVGYGHDGNAGNPYSLILHDPDTRAVNDYIAVETITEGTLLNGGGDWPRSAAGFLRFKVSPTTYGIIGGVVYLSLGDNPAPVA